MTESISRLGPDFRTWMRNDPRVREAILSGSGAEVVATSYGENDFLLEFLMGSGLWESMVSLRPRGLKKENGKPWRALNGVEVLRELASVDRIAHCGRVIRDTRLMLIAGFNAEEIGRARRRKGLVVTPETLSNHLARMHAGDVMSAFYGHVALLQKRKWLPRGTYAADGHEIVIPHGRGWTGMGKVGEAHGYRMVLLTRVDPKPERAVGFAVGPLQTSERLLLRMILREIERRVCPVRRLIDTLVLDRGYWGAAFLLEVLRGRFGLHFVTRAQHDELGLVKDVEGLLRLPGAPAPVEKEEERSRLGRIKVQVRGLEKVPLFEGARREVGTASVSVADEYDMKGRPLLVEDGKPRGRFYYVTDLPVAKDPYLPRQIYRKRWGVENEGFRTLTQRWNLDIPAGRNLSAIVARIFFALVLANAESIVRELFPGPWQEERRRLGRLGVPGFIGGTPTLAAYTEKGELGLLTTQDYGGLVRTRERNRIHAEVLEAVRRNEGVDGILARLGLQRPPPA